MTETIKMQMDQKTMIAILYVLMNFSIQPKVNVDMCSIFGLP